MVPSSYPGTWIPVERGLMLSKQYNVEDLMRPIIDYIATAESPPQAPKHITAAPTARVPKKPKVAGTATSTPTKASATTSASNQPSATPQSARTTLKSVLPSAVATAKADAAALERKAKKDREEKKASLAASTAAASLAAAEKEVEDAPYDLVESASSVDDESVNGSPSRRSSSSRSPSPILGSDDPIDGGQGGGMHGNEAGANGRKRKFTDGYEPAPKRPTPFGGEEGSGYPMQYSQPQQYSHPMHGGFAPSSDFMGAERYEETILDYFITETSQIPSILLNPPSDYDPNQPIDGDGHTALHWACAMGRIRVVKLLLAAGADIFRVNHSEQTPLMRSVMFSNNYDVRKFPELYELLHRSTLNIDKNNRTVFHHISDVALSKGKTHAARYYMETILGRLAEYPKELGDVVNFQDDEGETAITLAARARSKRLVKALLDHGADPKLANRDGKTAEDYILEDERFRSSPIVGGGQTTSADRAGPGSSNGHLTNSNYINHQLPGSAPPGPNVSRSFNEAASLPSHKLFHSHSAQLAAGKTSTELANLLSTLARSYDEELQAKEREISHANGLLTSIQTELSETKRQTEAMRAKLGRHLDDGHTRLTALEKELEQKMEQNYALGYSEWSASQDERLASWRKNASQHTAEDVVNLHELTFVPPVEASVISHRKVLAGQLENLQAQRRELFGQYVAAESGRGTGEKMSKYRRIVRASVGAQEEDVDDTVARVLKVSLSPPLSVPTK